MKTLLDVIKDGQYAPGARLMQTIEAKEALIEFLAMPDEEAQDRFNDIEYVVTIGASLDIISDALKSGSSPGMLDYALVITRRKAFMALKVAVHRVIETITDSDVYDVHEQLHMGLRIAELTNLLGELLAGGSEHVEMHRIHKN